jgi:hypothetical protein
MTAAEELCLYLDSEAQYSARTWLRTTAQWQAEGLPSATLRQLELGLLTAAHGLVGHRIKGLRGETRRVVLDCLMRVVHEEAVAAYYDETEISRLAAMDAAS